MTDYSFMKTGRNETRQLTEKNIEDLQDILCLFTNNAMIMEQNMLYCKKLNYKRRY